jgi:PPM family protein phosphatase
VQISLATATDKLKNDDIAEVFEDPGRTVIVLADGATGIGFGHIAARFFADRIGRFVRSEEFATGRRTLSQEFRAIDLALQSEVDADTTGIVVIAADGGLRGCSVGDSEAWLLTGNGRTVLTAGQNRKPRIGSGRAQPVAFGPVKLGAATLLVASDGLFNCLSRNEIEAILGTGPPDRAAEALLQATRRANSGRLPDDFSAIVVSELVAW